MAASGNSETSLTDGKATLVFSDPRRESVIYRRFGPVAVGAALALSLVTFVVFAGFTPIIPTTSVVLALLTGDAIVVAIVLSLILIELRRLRMARRASRAGARLHSRVIALFSLVAAVPALLTAVVATVSVEWAINPAFMRNIGSFVIEAGQSSRLYKESQCQSLLRDAELTAGDLSRSAPLLKTDPELFQNYLNSRSQSLGFSVAAIIKTDGTIVGSAKSSDAKLLARPQASDFADSDARQPFCALLNGGAVFVALRPIEGMDSSYFYAGRKLDPTDEQLGRDAQIFTEVFSSFQTHRRNIELGFGIVFIMLSLTLLISAVWMGLTFANYLVGPIRRLIRATDEVASGNLYVQVPTHKSEGDLGHLGQTFNKMTAELRQQHRSLTAANALLEERRAFIEAALSGVPAGVIGVDAAGVVGVCNAAAERLAGGQGLKGKRIEDVSPRLGEILAEARAGRARLTQAQATLSVNGRDRLINVRVTGDPLHADQGLVITLDDISELVAAQRSAAWADVARRIAHEIKNPLTPIQLSAERLKRRYGRHIVEGKDIFDQCTDTIIRQVDDIKRMVDEFSNFARMPKARLARDDLSDCVRQALFLARVGRADIKFEDDLPAEPLWAEFDRRLISQALTNVLKNAGEGVDARPATAEPGRISVTLRADAEGNARIAVRDNGKGFPKDDRLKLLEPYVTTRAEGTGLGLPIVIKILEDHGGSVELLDGLPRDDGGIGAEVLLSFPLRVATIVVTPTAVAS